MLSYQHAYHAGIFADVVKHVTLSRILHYLSQKDKPILYLETHAGRGLYDLHSPEAMKTGEATQGILQVLQHQDTLPDVFLPYLEAIRACNPDGNLRYYPGSPMFDLHQLRTQDRLYCCELHPQEVEALQRIKHQHPHMKMHVSHADFVKQLSALLPPPERRALVFIDPSYEIKTDYQRIPEAVSQAYRRFHEGVYCIWYPMLNQKRHIQMCAEFDNISEKSLRIEFHLNELATVGMTGCGLWVINPPYVLATELDEVLSVLVPLLNIGHSSYELVLGCP